MGHWDSAARGGLCLQALPRRKYSQKACITFRAMWGDTDSGAVNTTARDIWIAICAPLPPPRLLPSPSPPPPPCYQNHHFNWRDSTGLGWAGLGWGGEECDVINIAHCTPLLTNSHLTHIPDIQWKDRFKRSLFLRILKLFNMTDGRKFEFNHCWH